MMGSGVRVPSAAPLHQQKPARLGHPSPCRFMARSCRTGSLPRFPAVGPLALRRLQRTLVDQPLGLQPRQRTIDPPVAVERPFGEEHVRLNGKEHRRRDPDRPSPHAIVPASAACGGTHSAGDAVSQRVGRNLAGTGCVTHRLTSGCRVIPMEMAGAWAASLARLRFAARAGRGGTCRRIFGSVLKKVSRGCSGAEIFHG